MTRSPVPAETGPETTTVVFLFEVVFRDPSDGSEEIVRLSTAGQPVTVDADGDGSAETYEAAGKMVKWGGEAETTDRRGQGALLKMSGVDQSIISTLLQNNFRGQRVRIWRAKGDPAAGTWDDTVIVHRGLQLSDYEVREKVPEDDNKAIEAVVETRSTSRLVALQATNAVRTNPRSHAAMLAREGLSTVDNFFQYVAQLPGRVFWATESPDPALDGTGPGDPGGGGGGPGTGDEFQPGLPGQ